MRLVTLTLLCGAQLVLATDIYREPWHWGTDLPTQLTASSRTTPTLAAFKRFRFGSRTTMQQLVATFGQPNGFARQFPVTCGTGVPIEHLTGYGPEAGTFRYVLHGGGEVFISVTDFRTIAAVTCFSGRGERNTIYERETERGAPANG